MLRSIVTGGVLMLATSATTGTFLRAADVTPDDPKAAEKVVAEWYAAFTEAKTIFGEMDAKIEATGKGQSPRSEIAAYRLVIERPNKLLLASTRGPGLAVVADDKQVYEYLAAKKKFHVKDKPLTSIADLTTAEVLSYANYGVGLGILDAALRSASFEAFFARFTSPEYVGVEPRGVPAHHLRLTQDGNPFDVWFTVEGAKLLRVTVPDMRPALNKLAEREPMVQSKPGETPVPKDGFPPEVNVSMTITYKNWKLDAPLMAAMFKIPPAPGAEKVYDIFAEPDHPLLGKQAPGFATTTLQGQPLNAGQLAGKVVMLDFWATWCPPCVAALPKVNETAAKYRDKGVVFLAVNQAEDAADINQFLTEKNLNVPVVMDPNGAIAKLYAVSGIPQTVIIDKKGMVQVVHVGAGPNIGDELARNLDDVLAGKDLLAETVKKKP